MKFRYSLLVFISLLSIALCGEDSQKFPPQPPPETSSTSTTPKPNPPPPPTTHKPNPPPPTTPKPTPDPSPPPTTHKPNPPPPTTHKPDPPAPTTHKPNPPPPTTHKPDPPAPTTHKPDPSPPHTTPKPNPPTPPKPEPPTKGTWSVNNTGSNTACLLVQAAIQIKVPYITNNGSIYDTYVNVPSNATSVGMCKENGQGIILRWKAMNNTLSLEFIKNGTQKYLIRSISISLTPDEDYFPDAKGNTTISLHHTNPEFETTLDKSYKCEKKQHLNLTEDDSNNIAVLYISSFQFEAFHNSTNNQFTSAEDCAPFDTPDIVPIAVGCALAALVLIVLAAYLIGRRRRQARGYLSM